MADILPFMYWKKYFEVFCYLKVFSNYHLSSILNKIKTTLYMLFYFQRKNHLGLKPSLLHIEEQIQRWDNFGLGQLWAGTTLGWDNFGLGQL